MPPGRIETASENRDALAHEIEAPALTGKVKPVPVAETRGAREGIKSRFARHMERERSYPPPFVPMKFSLLLSLTSLAVIALPLHSQDLVFTSSSPKASLVELYSSEGCSSCPAAEAWLGHLKADPGLWRDVFPIAFHVDYWDNLGWKDRFANVTFTQRQLDYSNRFRDDSVYTPEFIVNGLEWKRTWLSNSLPDQGAGKVGDLLVRQQATDRTIFARYSPALPVPAGNFTINVALLGFNEVTDVKHGENGGQRLQHDFVALGFGSAKLTPGADGAFRVGRLKVAPIAGETPGALVAWVSDADGKILQITGGWIPHTKPAVATQ